MAGIQARMTVMDTLRVLLFLVDLDKERHRHIAIQEVRGRIQIVVLEVRDLENRIGAPEVQAVDRHILPTLPVCLAEFQVAVE
jgi:hypothetical protein